MKSFGVRVLLAALALCAAWASAEVEFSDIVRWGLVRRTDSLPAETPRECASVPLLAVDAKGQSEVMVTLTNDVSVLAPTNAVDGRALKWRFTASGGDRTVTWPTNSFRVPSCSTMAYANTVSNGTASVFVTEYHAAKGQGAIMDKTSMLAYLGGIVRVATSILGGYLAQKGLATQAETEGLAGAAVVVGTGLWSIWAKRKALLTPPPASARPPTAALCLPFLLCALLLGASGCLTRTRCQALTFDACTFNVNEPVGTDDPKYPRSLQIGVNDQQIEGGTDTIASGNKTDPSLQVPMGDSALSYLGQLLGGLVKGNPAAAPAASATSASACADGSCTVP